MEFTVCVTRGVDGDISTEVTRGGGPPGHAVAGGFFLGPYPLGPLGREGLDDGLDFGCFMSSLFGAISRRIVRPPPDIPPPEGVADLPIVRELVVRALAARVVADSTSFLPLTDPDFDPYRGSLKALGRLACVSRGYRDDVNDPYVVTRLLDGVAAPKWRDWAKAWRGVNDPGKRLETPQTPNPRTGLHRLTLGDVHALLRAEHVAKYVIDASNVAHFDEHALPERVTWRPSTLRASVAFPPPPEPAPEPNPVIPEGLQKVRTELEKVRPKFTADVERNVTLMRERDALVDTLERNGEALREKFESRADSAGDVFVAAALLKPELPSAHLEEDDRLRTVKNDSLEKSFEELQQASFDRTDSHDLYSKYIPMIVEELQEHLTRHEETVSFLPNLPDGGQRLKDRIQLLKELIPIKEREYKAEVELMMGTVDAAEVEAELAAADADMRAAEAFLNAPEAGTDGDGDGDDAEEIQRSNRGLRRAALAAERELRASQAQRRKKGGDGKVVGAGHEFGAFEAHTSGFGSRMLAKMGFQGEGSGVGKDGSGISEPITASMRAKRVGLGAER